MISQKGGVGKSTIAQLLAVTYAKADWSVKIADLDTNQMTSTEWVGVRLKNAVEPAVAAEPFNSVSTAIRGAYDLIVLDGKPHASKETLEIARACHQIVIPTSTTVADLVPAVRLAIELRHRGIDKERIILVLNQTADAESQLEEARRYLNSAGYKLANNDLPVRAGYRAAQNSGRAVIETTFPTLNERADLLAQELVDHARPFIDVAEVSNG